MRDDDPAQSTTIDVIDTDGARRWRRMVYVAVAIFVVGVAVSILRIPADIRGIVWAEDGAIFFQQSEDRGGLLALLTPYSGYLHVIPRITATAVLAVLPVSGYAWGMTVASALLTAGVAVLVFWLSKSVVAWLPARIALGLITILIPLSAQEVLGNLANFHWYLLWLAPWLVLARPRRWLFGWLLGLVALLSSLTEIQMALFLPLALLRWRDKRSWPIFGALIAGVATQFFTTVFFPRSIPTEARPPFGSIVYGYIVNVILPLVNPSAHDIGIMMAGRGILIAAVIVGVLFAAFVLIMARGTRDQRVLAVGLPLASVIAFSVAYYLNVVPGFFYAQFTRQNWLTAVPLLRYGVAAGMLLAALVPLAASVLATSRRIGERENRHRLSLRVASWAIIVGIIAVFAFACTLTGQIRGQVESWSSQIDSLASSCAIHTSSMDVDIATAPNGWKAEVNCDDLDH